MLKLSMRTLLHSEVPPNSGAQPDRKNTRNEQYGACMAVATKEKTYGRINKCKKQRCLKLNTQAVPTKYIFQAVFMTLLQPHGSFSSISTDFHKEILHQV